MTQPAALVVMYHYVRDTEATGFASIRALTPAMFRRQLDWLHQEHQIVHPWQLENAVRSGSALPPNPAVLTFDDGFIDHYQIVLPILSARRLSGVFFVTRETIGDGARLPSVHKTHFLLAALGAEAFGQLVREECERLAEDESASIHESADVFGRDEWEHASERAIKHLLNYTLPYATADRVLNCLFERCIGDEREFARTLYLSEAMIREMRDAGMVFGYHTRSHRMLSRLPVAGQEQELCDGVRWIRELTGQQDIPFCYPWGGPDTYTAETVSLLERYGYSVGYNTVRRRVVVGRDHRFELPRVDTRDLPPHTSGEPTTTVSPQLDEA